jgi:hypothetical protein
MYKIHLFQYKLQFNKVFDVNPWNQGSQYFCSISLLLSVLRRIIAILLHTERDIWQSLAICSVMFRTNTVIGEVNALWAFWGVRGTVASFNTRQSLSRIFLHRTQTTACAITLTRKIKQQKVSEKDTPRCEPGG